ncbi:MAG: nuclear transport factor 2 family protein, partial [Luminiphilus sp.]|nr:nuclear transport factor 2 family protein [Luminiphilus sp.]
MINYDEAMRVCETYIHALVTNDVEAILDLYADDATVEDPVGTESRSGKDALRSFYTGAVTGVVEAALHGAQQHLAERDGPHVGLGIPH